MQSIHVEHISKRFGDTQAVKDISFDVVPGEIFGLLGPNGSGKTTSIRIILDIYQPDAGSVSILGGPMTEAKKNQIGYLPEERGLYQDILVDKCLEYLATLKGLNPQQIRQKLPAYLEEFDLSAHKKKKVKELSKGMQQKAQLINTLVHNPEIVIIDEPFSALDPVNTQMVKDLLREERDRGTTIIMCTHQMHQVEELGDRIALINKGETVLYGELEGIQRQFQSDGVLVRSTTELPATLPGVSEMRKHNSSTLLKLNPGVTTQEILQTLLEKNIQLEQFEIAIPTLDEIFIRVVNQSGAEE